MAQPQPVSKSDARDVATDTYTPDRSRSGIGLCLSGGGYRAALFHLGAIRRLNELGVLHNIRTITSVSGGSIIAAFLASRVTWPIHNPIPNFDAAVATPLREFTRHNIRTKPILKRLLPWNWPRTSTGVEALASEYEKLLTSMKLSQLPAQPAFVLCATDMAFADNWVFERDRMGAYQPGYVRPVPPDWPLARSVAASSCFPPVFNPLPVNIEPTRFENGKYPAGNVRDTAIRELRLTDGGVYDNLGLEPVWKDHAVVLASDGGGILSFSGDQGILWRVQRYTGIVENQAEALRKRWLISNFTAGVLTGTYWGIGSARSSYDQNDSSGYSKDLAVKTIAEIRTDLDAFSDAEAGVLENHGYLVTDAALKKHIPTLVGGSWAPLKIPHPKWDPQSVGETQIRTLLKDSSKRQLLGRS